MARIRSIHPSLYTDEEYMALTMDTPLACVMLTGIWNESDDQGIFEWKPLSLKARVLPAASVDASSLLDRLARGNFIQRFSVAGKSYGAVRNFQKFQRPKKPNSIHPLPEELRTYVGRAEAGSEPTDDDIQDGSQPEAVNPGVVPHQLPTSGEKSPQMEDGGDKGKRKEEGRKQEPPSVPQAAAASPSAQPEARGHRLPADWQPSAELGEFAASLGLSCLTVSAQFIDYWHAQPGTKGRKTDWDATWRNWCRKEAERRPTQRASPNQPASKLAWMPAAFAAAQIQPPAFDLELQPEEIQ